MLHNHHSKSKGLKQLVLRFTTNHPFTRDRVQNERVGDAEKKKEGEPRRLPSLQLKPEVLICFLTNESRDIEVVSACAHHRPRKIVTGPLHEAWCRCGHGRNRGG